MLLIRCDKKILQLLNLINEIIVNIFYERKTSKIKNGLLCALFIEFRKFNETRNLICLRMIVNITSNIRFLRMYKTYSLVKYCKCCIYLIKVGIHIFSCKVKLTLLFRQEYQICILRWNEYSCQFTSAYCKRTCKSIIFNHYFSFLLMIRRI